VNIIIITTTTIFLISPTHATGLANSDFGIMYPFVSSFSNCGFCFYIPMILSVCKLAENVPMVIHLPSTPLPRRK
jgi:hypothetical protein